MAGIGKTTLAVHWAHRVAPHYPDGQLYINLRGFDPTGAVVSPAKAVRTFLNALGVPPQAIPDALDAQAALYRSLLADRRMLVLLDNARDAEQVRPLLPGSPGCLTIVTSRSQLTGLIAGEGAQPLTLSPLTPAESHGLLARRVGAAWLAAEPEVADEIVEFCGRLPLALAIVAARAATNPGFTLSTVARELRESQGNLDALTGGDPASDVRTVFSWSYDALSAPAARLFRLLGLHCGPDISAPAAAALAGLPLRETRGLLAEITRLSLLNEHAPGRYAPHDLLRVYAAERASAAEQQERDRAVERLLCWYLHATDAVFAHLSPGRRPLPLDPLPPQVEPMAFASRDQALQWCERERFNFVAIVHQAAASHRPDLAWRLTAAFWGFYPLQGTPQDWLDTARTSLEDAREAGNRRGEAWSLNEVAVVLIGVRRSDEAIEYLREAMEMYRQLGDTYSSSRVVSILGVAYLQSGQLDEAVDHLDRALALSRACRDEWAEGIALSQLGDAFRQLGRFDEAIHHLRNGLKLLRATGYLWIEALTLDSLGVALHRRQRHDEAIEYYYELLGQAELRELLDAEVLTELERELQWLTEDRRVKDPEGVADVLRLLGPLTDAELAERGAEPHWVQELAGARRAIKVRIAGTDHWAAIEDAGRLRDALGTALPVGVPEAFTEPVKDPLGDLLARFARTHGPFTSTTAAGRFGLGVAITDGALQRLAASGRVVQGEFHPAGIGQEWCDAAVLRRLRRRSLAALRHELEPVPPPALAQFLPQWQHIGKGHGLRGVDGLVRAIEQLQGASVPASALEKLVLPSRVANYTPAMLDELTSAGEVVWAGAGSLPGKDGWVSLYMADTAPLLLPRPHPLELTALHQSVLDALSGGYGLFFRQIADQIRATTHPDVTDPQLADTLWELAWSGRLTNDTLAPMRSVLGSGRTAGSTAHRAKRTVPRGRYGSLSAAARPASRTGPPTVAGRWSLLPAHEPDATVRAHALARTLLDRHGVVTRGAVAAEGVEGGFSATYRILSAFEESGQARRGYVVEGLGAAQFAMDGAVDRLRAVANARDRGDGLPGPTARDTGAPDTTDGRLGPFGAPAPYNTPDGFGSSSGFDSSDGSTAQDADHPGAPAYDHPDGTPTYDIPDLDHDFLDAHLGPGDYVSPRDPSSRNSPRTPQGTAWHNGGTPYGSGPASRRPTADTRAVVLAAADPANAYGAALTWPEPPTGAGHKPGRKAGSLVVLVDGELTLYMERGGKTLLAWPSTPDTEPTDDPRLHTAAEALAAAARAGSLGTVTVERVNGAAALTAPIGTLLEGAGFIATPRGLRLRA
ncbi:tetratricopeptide repeat protein [Streptomyces sp. NPDC006356]